MNDEYKWIRHDMGFKKVGKCCQHKIRIQNSDDLAVDFYKYSYEFFSAAECVMNHLRGKASKMRVLGRLDFWYFPLIYLYRQSLELLLKANLFKVAKSDNERKEITSIGHDLKEGYDKLLEKVALKHSIRNSSWLGKYLADISQIDKNSDMFRYPFNFEEEPLFYKQTHISLVATNVNMNKAYDILNELYLTGRMTEKEYVSYEPKLIVEGGQHDEQCFVGYESAQNSFNPYFLPYKEVGNFLSTKVITENNYKLFLPMCYLYRNTVELGLKRILVEDSCMGRSKALEKLKKMKHGICALWNAIKGDIYKYSNALSDDTTIIDAEHYIKEIHNFDGASDKFRYPCDKNLNIYFKKGMTLDMENVASYFEELCYLLECVDDAMKNYRDMECDMYYDYGLDVRDGFFDFS